LDVGGHEMTHGVVQKTANLVYKNQSGALNEIFADVFGVMIDRDDWKLGEDIVKAGQFPKNALRDLSDPHNGGTSLSNRGYQPRHMNEFYTGTQDNGGVHINSGIPNWAYYKYATAITLAKAEKVYYRALSMYLSSSSEFLDCRYAVVKAAVDLYGAGSTEETAAKTAFDAVGIYDPNPSQGGSGGGSTGNGTFDLPTNTGTESILLTNTDPGISNTLYLFNPTSQGFTAISTTKNRHMPSVLDNGSAAAFINDAKQMIRINLTSPYSEQVISPNAIWSRVAYSKDGTKVAAITTDKDTSIHVYSFAKSTWKVFKLYNPTFSSGVNSGGVLYADALEWDQAGENLVYDALSEVKLGNGSTKTYWDIGIINVWDNEAADWGDGKVEKLFNQLEDGISIGNPTIARNSPHIIAFDYLDFGSSIYGAIGMNINSRENKTIALTSNACVPTYNVQDKYLFFTDETTDEDIYIRELDANKIDDKVGSSSVKLISEAKWGYSFANGARRLLHNENDLISYSFSGLSPAVKGTITGNNIALTVPFGTDVKDLTASFTHSPASKVSVATINQTSSVSSQNYTSPVIYKVKAQDASIKTYTVTVTVDQTNSTNLKSKLPLKIYPNPSTGLFHSSIKNASYQVFTLTGQRVAKGEIIEGELDLGSLESGNYILKVEADGQQSSEVITIE